MNDSRSRPRRCTHSAAAVQPPASASSGATAGITSRLRRARQLLVDDFLELVEGLGPGDHAAVDEECRRSGHPDAGCVRDVLVDVGLELLVLEALVELRLVEPQLAGECLQPLLAEIGLRPQLVVVLPELPLRARARRGLGGRPRVRMELEREVAVDEADLVAVGGEHLFHRLFGTLAKGAFVVRELDDGHRRLLGTARRSAGGRDVDLRRLQRHGGLVLALQLGDERLLTLAGLLLLQELDDARLHLVERLSLELRLVVVVDLLDIGVRRVRHLRGDLCRNQLLGSDVARLRLLLDQLLADELVESFAEHLVALVVDLDQLRLHVLLERLARDRRVGDRGDGLRGRGHGEQAGNCNGGDSIHPPLLVGIAGGRNRPVGPRILCNWRGPMVAARRVMRLRQRFPGLVAALLSLATLAACATSIRDLNLRPDKHYQQKLSVVGRIMRLQSVDGETLVEIADRRENRLLVRTTQPMGASVGDWVKVTGVLVPESRVGDTTVYDLLVAEDISPSRGPWLPDIM